MIHDLAVRDTIGIVLTKGYIILFPKLNQNYEL